jgi:hypothetical protein
MKAVRCFLLCLAAASATQESPVTRIVNLLKGLSEKVEKEGKAEEDLFETYVCWGKSVVEQKTASNAAAESKIDTLEAYIADLESGRITLTSERGDLEKDIAELMADLEEAKKLRATEKADFEDAKAEMTSAITALKSAIDVLGKATKDHKEGVLIAVRSSLNQGMEAFQQQQVNLKHAVKLGERFLDKADATFLRRLLTGDVPSVDNKKLNRKATFKMAYKARSFKIQDVLNKMHETFTANLQEAEQNEADAQSSYDQLAKAKGEQLSAAQDALTKGEVESGARGSSKQEAQDEAKNLKAQVKADTRFIAETTTALENKKKEWKVRSELRTGELAALSKAISILFSDKARDNFKKSFASQEGFFFLQEGSQSASAASVLRSAAKRSGDSRLVALAQLVADPSAKDKFGPIIGSIDKMIQVMKDNEAEDLKIKEECEKGRMEDTRTAALASRAVDDMTDAMTKLDQEIAQAKKEIDAKTADRATTAQELKEAKKNRAEENAEWKENDASDAEAAVTVENAKKVLVQFYKDNNLQGVGFVQSDAPDVQAGEAPPPPPPTFEGGYGGKTGESQGIVSIMEMVYEDIISDQKKAKAGEDDAQAAFDKFEKDSNAEIKSLTKQIEGLNGVVGKKQTEHGNTKDQRGTKKGELNAVIAKMADIAPNCEYFAVNYKLRATNRAVELDGLLKAKAILNGGTFSKGPDPNRAIKPGDAFLQRH